MAIYKIRAVTLFFSVLIMNACHLITQDDLSGTGLSPDPIFQSYRNMVILPISLPKGERVANNIGIGTTIQSSMLNYLQFINTIPGSLENTVITNEQDIWDFYGATNPTKEKQLLMLKQTIQDNKKHWLLVSPEDHDEIYKRYTFPADLKVNISQGEGTALAHFNTGDIVVQLTLTERYILKVSIFDPILEKYLDKWSVSIPKQWAKSTGDTVSNIDKLLKPYMKKSLEKITKKKYFEVTIPPLTREYSVFIEGKILLSKNILLSKGLHSIYISQQGDIIQSGKVDIQHNGQIDIQLDNIQTDGYKITFSSHPTSVPLFVDEKYIGLTPISATLPVGEHYIRLSNNGYSHLNYILNVDPYKPIKAISINMNLQDQKYLDNIQFLRKVKMASFMSGIMTAAAFFYTHERTNFYLSKINNNVDRSQSIRRYNQFLVSQIVFGGLSIGFSITALVFQILEYQARDIGIGVNEDGNLGINYHF